MKAVSDQRHKTEDTIMNDTRSIRARMRARQHRLAVVYIRYPAQPHTSADHAEIAYQRAQVGHARAWGWPPDNILILDEDIGHGRRRTTSLKGYKRLFTLVAEGRVGLLLVDTLARLSAAPSRLIGFLQFCQQRNTLVVADGVIVNRSDPAFKSYERLWTVAHTLERRSNGGAKA